MWSAVAGEEQAGELPVEQRPVAVRGADDVAGKRVAVVELAWPVAPGQQAVECEPVAVGEVPGGMVAGDAVAVAEHGPEPAGQRPPVMQRANEPGGGVNLLLGQRALGVAPCVQ